MHFVTRDRLGRLATFVARQYADGVAPAGVLGIGVDESNALLVDKNGLATLVQQGGRNREPRRAPAPAYSASRSARANHACQAGQALLYKNLTVTRLANPKTDSFNLAQGCGTGVSFSLTVDGTSTSNPYSSNPYKAAGVATKLPLNDFSANIPRMKIKAIITGATGMVGEGVLLECLAHSDVEEVLVINRKPGGVTHPKLREIIHADFFNLAPIEAQLSGYNACFFCLGISSVGVSKEEYRRTTYDLTLNVAQQHSCV